jgi:hypothetical protein
VLQTFGMTNCKSVPNPCLSTDITNPVYYTEPLKLNVQQHHEYRSIIGSLMYLANTTRIDICYATNLLARYCDAPYAIHMKAAKHLLRYLTGTSYYSLTYKRNDSLVGGDIQSQLVIHGYSDADHASDSITRTSTLGNIITLNGNVIHWLSQRQKSVSLSSTESEYVAMNSCSREIIWFQNLLHDIFHVHTHTSKIYIDNQAAQAWAEEPALNHKRAKHIDIRYKFVKDCIYNDLITLQWKSTDYMLADVLTKPLTADKFYGLIKHMVNGNIHESHLQ